MVIDSSALLAILFEEPDASVYTSTILSDLVRLLSAVSLVETSMVSTRLAVRDFAKIVDELIWRLKIEVIAVDHHQALFAREAFLQFGKGRHKAGLNFGDCFSYALARQKNQPLLYKGDDFKNTDISSA